MSAESAEQRARDLSGALPEGLAGHDDRPVPRKRLLAALLTVNIVAVIVAVVVLRHLHDHTLREAEVRSQNIALAVDLNLSNEINKIDLSLRTVVAQLNQRVTLPPRISIG